MKEVYKKLMEERKQIVRRQPAGVLADLINANDYRIVGEIGVGHGRTSKKILKKCSGVKTYWAVDRWIHYISGDRYKRYSDDDWELMYTNVCNLTKWFPSLRVLRMESVKAARLFPSNYFDLLFIDADHSYESVKVDTTVWMPKVKIGGLFCGHDYADSRENGTYRKKYRGVVQAVDEIVGRENLMLLSGNIWAKEM